MNCFSESFEESRDKFRAMAKQAGGVLKRVEHSTETDRDGKPLTVDFAVFGSREAERIFFNLNGVHGMESPAGAAAQLDLMSSGSLAKLREGTSVVLVHSINPFGWVNSNQLNEDGVDLNRNFMDFNDLPDTDALYARIAAAVDIDVMSFGAMAHAYDMIMGLSKDYGEERFTAALMRGQYSDPNGLKYGGNQPTWSNTVLRDIACEEVSQAEYIAFLDWHTGIGEYGKTVEIPMGDNVGPGSNPGEDFWGRSDERQPEQSAHGMDIKMDTLGTAVQGPAIAALQNAAKSARTVGGVVEFGTVPFDLIVQATVLNLWAFSRLGDPGIQYWKAQLRTMFAPRCSIWEQAVLSRARQTYSRALSALQSR